MECGYGLDATGQPVTANGNVDLTGLPLELAEPPLRNGIGGSRAIPDPSSPLKIVNFHAIGGFTNSGVVCDRAAVRCLPNPVVNGHVGAGDAPAGMRPPPRPVRILITRQRRVNSAAPMDLTGCHPP
jgi:hypothetical protein